MTDKKLTQQEATAEIKKLRDQAEALIREAEEIAEEYEIKFRWDLAYGMGGWYGPVRNYWDSSSSDEDLEWDWQASSQSC